MCYTTSKTSFKAILDVVNYFDQTITVLSNSIQPKTIELYLFCDKKKINIILGKTVLLVRNPLFTIVYFCSEKRKLSLYIQFYIDSKYVFTIYHTKA